MMVRCAYRLSLQIIKNLTLISVTPFTYFSQLDSNEITCITDDAITGFKDMEILWVKKYISFLYLLNLPT